MRRFACVLFALILLVLAIISVSATDDTSIGIIGGADGPTVILVGNLMLKRVMSIFGFVAVATIGFAVGFIVGRKTKK